jgi:hypothetical protein
MRCTTPHYAKHPDSKTPVELCLHLRARAKVWCQSSHYLHHLVLCAAGLRALLRRGRFAPGATSAPKILKTLFTRQPLLLTTASSKRGQSARLRNVSPVQNHSQRYACNAADDEDDV